MSTFLLPGLGKGRSCFVLVEELEMITVPWGWGLIFLEAWRAPESALCPQSGAHGVRA